MPTRPLIFALAVLSGEPGEVNREEVARIYLQGQEHAEAKEYEAALERFETLLDMFSEVEDNKTTRESLILNIVEMSRHAYEGVLNEDGSRNDEVLERGLERVRRYEADYEAAYGVPSGESVAEAKERLLQLREVVVGPCLSLPPCLSPCLSPPPCLSAIEPKRGCGGESGGVASLMLLPFALRRRRKSILEQVAGVLPDDVVARIRQRLDADAEE